VNEKFAGLADVYSLRRDLLQNLLFISIRRRHLRFQTPKYNKTTTKAAIPAPVNTKKT
jgi:hypothetical protein